MHPLQAKKYRPLITRRFGARACVTVEVKGTELHLTEDMPCVCKEDTEWAELPKDFKVIGPNGKEIKSTWGFHVTTATINPLHLLCDAGPEHAQ